MFGRVARADANIEFLSSNAGGPVRGVCPTELVCCAWVHPAGSRAPVRQSAPAAGRLEKVASEM